MPLISIFELKIKFYNKKRKVYKYEKNDMYLHKSPKDQSPEPRVWGFLKKWSDRPSLIPKPIDIEKVKKFNETVL